ncbi:GIY-YIG nuclease family protein [Mesorhizobium sp. B2-2-2]|uniref:GIY-YIG nuclease family protein n=1 Tax=Mesorhizobium sp. B2-2-2 TaxID=2589964 RepID=UPI00112B3DAD|nr:GIY-YIG nuclease family protein [Mesorhizobium sp. B2-2-2]TPM27754.1 GIY-YIG nuclease family protein [Mesorhizobium sp. B2-2-2]
MASYFEQRMAEINAAEEARRASYVPPPVPKRPSPPAEHGHVYFMKAGKAVKIGRSTNLRSRFKSLQTGSAIDARIVKILPGGKRREKEFHKRFAEYRLRGEWFNYAARSLDIWRCAFTRLTCLKPTQSRRRTFGYEASVRRIYGVPLSSYSQGSLTGEEQWPLGCPET